MRLAYVRLPATHGDPQRDRTAGRVPDDTAGRFGGEHGQRMRVDQSRVAQISRTGSASGLLVAHEVQHDPTLTQEIELSRGQGAVEHAHQAALHVGGPTSDDPAVAPLRLEPRGVLGRDDVEVAVEVDRARTVADAGANDAGVLQLAGGRELDDLGREAQFLHRIVQNTSALTQPASRRVLGVDGDQLLQQRGHLIGARLEPGLYLGGRSPS